MLSHDEQLARLAASAPAAVPAAVVAGDPCLDRILASLGERDHHRSALGVGDRTLVMISSTWGSRSLFGAGPDLVHRLMAELPVDRFKVIMAIHPNARHGHGPVQWKIWLADCERSGLVVLPEIDGWRSGLIAADIVVGDHGAVTGYGAAAGRPVLLGAFPDPEVASGSPIAVLGELAPRLDPSGPLRPQLESTITQWPVDAQRRIAELASSLPGQSLERLRALCYRIMDLPEPDGEPPVKSVPPVKTRPADRIAAMILHVECMVDDHDFDPNIQMVRFPAELQRRRVGLVDIPAVDHHLVSPVNHPLRRLRSAAAVLIAEASDVRQGGEDQWLTTTIADHPSCMMAALVTPTRAAVQVRNGPRLEIDAPEGKADAALSAIYAWIGMGRSLDVLVSGATFQVDNIRRPFQVRIST